MEIQKSDYKYILIAFVDEVGSTKTDELAYSTVDVCKEESLKECKTKIIDRRIKLFSDIVSGIFNDTTAVVLKNIGDELVVILRGSSQEEAIKFMKTLYVAWNQIGSVRVGVHGTAQKLVITDGDLQEFRNDLIKNIPLLTDDTYVIDKWPALMNIAKDIFGAPMNLAARLASFPHGGQFVLSEEAAIILGYTDEEGELEKILAKPSSVSELAETGKIKLLAELNTAKADKFPIIKIKNVSRINIDSPWYAYEIYNKESKPALLRQSRSVQSVRVIELDDPDGYVEDYSVLWGRAWEKMRGKLFDSVDSLKFFIDLIFEVKGVKYRAKIRRDREYTEAVKFETEEEAKTRDTNKPRPAFLVFTSTPDFDSDLTIRSKSLSMNFNGQSLKANTMRIFGDAYFEKNEGHVYAIGKNYFFIEFQIRSNSVREPDKKSSVFKGVKTSFNRRNGFEVLSYGLLEGESDGYVLLASKSKTFDNLGLLLRNAEIRSTKVAKTFSQSLAPLAIYSLRLLKTNNNPTVLGSV